MICCRLQILLQRFLFSCSSSSGSVCCASNADIYHLNGVLYLFGFACKSSAVCIINQQHQQNSAPKKKNQKKKRQGVIEWKYTKANNYNIYNCLLWRIDAIAQCQSAMPVAIHKMWKEILCVRRLFCCCCWIIIISELMNKIAAIYLLQLQSNIFFYWFIHSYSFSFFFSENRRNMQNRNIDWPLIPSLSIYSMMNWWLQRQEKFAETSSLRLRQTYRSTAYLSHQLIYFVLIRVPCTLYPLFVSFGIYLPLNRIFSNLKFKAVEKHTHVCLSVSGKTTCILHFGIILFYYCNYSWI